MTEEQLEIGKWVVEQRSQDPPVPWKLLEREKCLSRATLNRYANAYRKTPTLEVVAQEVMASVKASLSAEGQARIQVNGRTVVVMMDLKPL